MTLIFLLKIAFMDLVATVGIVFKCFNVCQKLCTAYVSDVTDMTILNKVYLILFHKHTLFSCVYMLIA